MQKISQPLARVGTAEETAHMPGFGSTTNEVNTLRAELMRELAPSTAIERAAAADYVDLMCQSLSLRRLREKLERSFALASIWSELSNAMVQVERGTGADVASVEENAKRLVERLANGDWDARDEIQPFGVDIDEASMRGIADNLGTLTDIERQRERLSNRARQLLEDVERNANFMKARKRRDISDAEIVPLLEVPATRPVPRRVRPK